MFRWLRALAVSDMMYLTVFGLLAPIFALFLRERIPGVTLLTVGLAEGIYLLTIGILRPFSQLYSKNDLTGWRTQHLLWFGSFFAAMTPFLYLMARDMIDIYVIQILYGVGIVFCEPGWSRLMDKACQYRSFLSTERYNTIGTLTAAGLALIGGFIADQYGMVTLLIYMNVTIVVAAGFLCVLYWRFGLNKNSTKA
ncbi:MAG TPA: hypothetical protein PLF71_05235 [bacterium]|nr:MAG: hypothetical protein BWY14_00750 [Parcubacteria group bacterium ADurb.Bin192]HPN15479.1 hypothetical protein [bacterium]